MNLYIGYESFSRSGNEKISIVSSIEALENLLSPYLHKKVLREVLSGAASLHPLSDKKALLALKSEGVACE